MILEFSKVRDSARKPDRANPSDAGLDIFFCPEDSNPVVLRTNENKILGTGVKFGVPHGYMLQVMNRSSMAAKNNLVVGAHCIDSGYNGEVFIDLHNVGLVEKIVKPGDKIAQLVLVPVVPFRVLENFNDSLYEDPITISDRGTGALGSTNNKTSRFDNTANLDTRDHYRSGDSDLVSDIRSVARGLRKEAEPRDQNPQCTSESDTGPIQKAQQEETLNNDKNVLDDPCPLPGF